jgi:UDP-N-acetylmuramyl tripeptide synthase
VNRANAALITNVSEDHLGDFGSRNLDELLNIKWVVSHAVADAGALILNADNPLLVARSQSFRGRMVWFSLDADNKVVTEHCAAGGRAFALAGDDLLRIEGSVRTRICKSAEVPIALGGAAAHNVANALGAAALTEQLGMSLQQIIDGLTTMSQAANPGRSNLYPVQDYHVLVDFAHNPEAMQALFAMARAIPAKRRALCFGQAGDRTDRQIRELAQSAWAIGLDLVCIAELSDYRRGREEGEVYRMMREELLTCGASEHQIRYFGTETESSEAAMDWAGAGDVVVILDLGRNSDVHARIEKRQRT